MGLAQLSVNEQQHIPRGAARFRPGFRINVAQVKTPAVGAEGPFECHFSVANTGGGDCTGFPRAAIRPHVCREEASEGHHMHPLFGLPAAPVYIAECGFKGMANRGLRVPADGADANCIYKRIGLADRGGIAGIRGLRCFHSG